MGVTQCFGVSGTLKAIIKNEVTGAVRECEFDNKVTDAFLNRIAQMISGVNNTGQNAVLGIAKFEMGTGTGTVSSADIALFTPTSASMINVSLLNASTNQVTVTINYPQNYITGTFTEGGLYDINNVLLTHVLLSPSVQIVANESITFLYTITVNAA